MIRKTKKGPRRLREMPAFKLVEYVISGAGPYRGSVEPHTAYRTEPGTSSYSRWIKGDLYILIESCAHLNGGDWIVEMRKETR